MLAFNPLQWLKATILRDQALRSTCSERHKRRNTSARTCKARGDTWSPKGCGDKTFPAHADYQCFGPTPQDEFRPATRKYSFPDSVPRENPDAPCRYGADRGAEGPVG